MIQQIMAPAANEEPIDEPKRFTSASLSNKVSIAELRDKVAVDIAKSFDPSYIKTKPSMPLDERRREHQKQKVQEMTAELQSAELHTAKQDQHPTAILAASLPGKFEVRDAITTKGVAATVQWTLLDEHFQPCAEPESGPCGPDGIFSFHGRRLQEPANYLIEQIHDGHVRRVA
jgi:hypothetical protein